jgi:hypothetical protein
MALQDSERDGGGKTHESSLNVKEDATLDDREQESGEEERSVTERTYHKTSPKSGWARR